MNETDELLGFQYAGIITEAIEKELVLIRTIYHYANLEVAKCITGDFGFLGEGIVLWHTRADCFQDKSEGKVIEDVYRSVLHRLIVEGTIGKERYESLLPINPKGVYWFSKTDSHGIDHYSSHLGRAYIACFSTEKDSREMWENHLNGANDGAALGFDLLSLNEDSHRYYGRGYLHYFQKVLYKKEEQEEFIYQIIKPLVSKTPNSKLLNYLISDFLTRCQYVFKDEKYDYEKEVRSIIIIPEEGVCPLEQLEDGKRIKYRFGIGTRLNEITFYCEPKKIKDISRKLLAPRVYYYFSSFVK